MPELAVSRTAPSTQTSSWRGWSSLLPSATPRKKMLAGSAFAGSPVPFSRRSCRPGRTSGRPSSWCTAWPGVRPIRRILRAMSAAAKLPHWGTRKRDRSILLSQATSLLAHIANSGPVPLPLPRFRFPASRFLSLARGQAMVGQDPARFRRSTTATRFPCEASDQAKNLALPLPSTTTSYSSGCDTFFPLRVNSSR